MKEIICHSFQTSDLGSGKLHSETAVITSRDLGIFMGKIFGRADCLQFSGSQNKGSALKCLQQREFSSKAPLHCVMEHCSW